MFKSSKFSQVMLFFKAPDHFLARELRKKRSKNLLLYLFSNKLTALYY